MPDIGCKERRLRDEGLDVLTLDAGDCGGHARTYEDRGEEGNVVGVPANRAWRQVGRLQVQAPGLQKYAKLSYASDK
jgi:hypothetical protein